MTEPVRRRLKEIHPKRLSWPARLALLRAGSTVFEVVYNKFCNKPSFQDKRSVPSNTARQLEHDAFAVRPTPVDG